MIVALYKVLVFLFEYIKFKVESFENKMYSGGSNTSNRERMMAFDIVLDFSW